MAAAIMRIKDIAATRTSRSNTWFEDRRIQRQEVEEQMQYFAEEVKPLLAPRLRRPSREQTTRPELRRPRLIGKQTGASAMLSRSRRVFREALVTAV